MRPAVILLGVLVGCGGASRPPFDGAVATSTVALDQVVDEVAFLPDGTVLVATSSYPDPARPGLRDQRLRFLGPDGADVREAVPLFDALVTAMAASPDGRAVALGVRGAIRVEPLADGVEGRTLSCHVSIGGCDPIGRLAWTPDGTVLVAQTLGVMGPAIEVLRVADGSTVVDVPITPHAEHAADLALSPDGARLAVLVGDDATIPTRSELRVVRLPDGATTRIPLPRPTPFAALAWSPDGTRLALSSAHHGVTVVDPAAGTVVVDRPADPGSLDRGAGAAFLPGGDLLVVGTGQVIERLDGAALASRGVLPAHADEAGGRDDEFAVSADGRRVVGRPYHAGGGRVLHAWTLAR